MSLNAACCLVEGAFGLLEICRLLINADADRIGGGAKINDDECICVVA